MIPGQAINAPTKRNRTRPWTLAGSIAYSDAAPYPWVVTLTATLKSGQVRTYSYGVLTEQIAQWMVTSATNASDPGDLAKTFTRGRTGGKAFAIPIRARPVVVSSP